MREVGPPKWFRFPWHETFSFILGAFMLIWQTALEDQKSALIVGAGLALCGVAGSGAIQRGVRRAVNGE